MDNELRYDICNLATAFRGVTRARYVADGPSLS